MWNWFAGATRTALSQKLAAASAFTVSSFTISVSSRIFTGLVLLKTITWNEFLAWLASVGWLAVCTFYILAIKFLFALYIKRLKKVNATSTGWLNKLCLLFQLYFCSLVSAFWRKKWIYWDTCYSLFCFFGWWWYGHLGNLWPFLPLSSCSNSNLQQGTLSPPFGSESKHNNNRWRIHAS